MRIDPFISSIPISARTFGPYRLTRAACRPSLSRSISSLRSSCFVLVSSRIAETTSVAFAIYSPLVLVGNEPGVANLCDAKGALDTVFRGQHHRVLVRNRDNPRPHPAHPRQFHPHVAAHELRPVAVPAHGPLNTPAPHFPHIPITHGT